jgi:hypothetical protein
MKDKELIAELQTMDPEAELIIQKDAEGNGYSPLLGADHKAVYVSETTWYGEVYSTDYSAEDNCMEEAEWQEILARPRCVVLYPVN